MNVKMLSVLSTKRKQSKLLAEHEAYFCTQKTSHLLVHFTFLECKTQAIQTNEADFLSLTAGQGDSLLSHLSG